MKKGTLVCGVGVNDADYVVEKRKNNKRIWICPFYKTWQNLINRCYNRSKLTSRPTYKLCKVCDEWLTFSNFKDWMEKQDWEGKELDKDLLASGNKVYSPDYCVFITGDVNNFLLDSGNTRGEYLIGVCWHKLICKFTASCRNPFTKKQEFLGYFDDELVAHEAWRKTKHKYACQLADLQSDSRVVKALRERFN